LQDPGERASTHTVGGPHGPFRPLLLASSSHVDVSFQIVAPTSMRLPASLPGGELRDGDRSVVVKDSVDGNALKLVRVVDIPAGRVQPGSEYARFVQFTEQADQLVAREIGIGWLSANGVALGAGPLRRGPPVVRRSGENSWPR
jgi:hypothetical protein